MLLSAPGGERERGVCEPWVTRRRGNCIRFVDEGGGGGEFSAVHIDDGTIGKRVRQDREHACVPGELYLPGRQRVPRLVVPQIPRDSAGQPEPASSLVAAAAVTKGFECLLEGTDGGGVPVSETLD